MVYDAGEASVEFNIFVSELQPLSRGEAEIQNDLPFLHVRLGYLGAGAVGIDDHVRRVATVADPLMHGT
jgi:hypothetical protein